MSIAKDKKRLDFDATIAPGDGHKWSKEEQKLLEERAKLIHSQRSPERIRKNGMLSVLYRMEEYVLDDKTLLEQIITVENFVMDFCVILEISKTQFAKYLDTDVSNLNKYFRGQRAFNTELAMKLAHFFHTPVDVWLKVQLKNDLIALYEEEKSGTKYDKYDYEKALQFA